MMPILYIIVPCYNEEQVIGISAQMIKAELDKLVRKNKISPNSKIMFVNDGSDDDTWSIIQKMVSNDNYFIGISQSRNRGHQNAVFAGMMEARKFADITISIDCDGQDDVNAMEEMVDEYLKGSEIVYGVRNNRDSDTFFKKYSAELFYRLLNVLGVEAIFNHADYRLVSTKVIDELSGYREVNLFLRGMLPLVGYSSSCVYYERSERMAGKSHYTLSKMIDLAFNGITSLSIKPIRLILAMGGITTFLGMAWLVASIFMNISGTMHTELNFFIAIMMVFTGIQLTCMGVLGEYIGKTYMETKNRPRYIISNRIGEVYENEAKFHVLSNNNVSDNKVIHM